MDPASAELCRRYWKPLAAYARARGYSPESASDLTQVFFEHLTKTSPGTQGRLRTFLLASLKDFILRDRHREPTRSGDAACHLNLDAATEDPETLYEREWAQAVLANALLLLRDEQEDRFNALRPLLAERGEGDAEELRAFRRRYGELVREEVLRLVNDPADVDDEIAHLMRALAG